MSFASRLSAQDIGKKEERMNQTLNTEQDS